MSIVQKGKETNLNPAAYGLSNSASVRKEGVVLGEPLSGLRMALVDLISDTVDLTHRAWGFHWNVSGSDFAQYHELFGEIYESLSDSIDPIAENIQKIGFDAPFDIREFASNSSIPLTTKPTNPQSMAIDLYTGLDALVICLNRAFDVATMTNEQGIANFIADRLDITKKWMWQLRKSASIA